MTSDPVKQLFLNPKNVGTVGKAESVGKAGSLRCGATLRFSLAIDESQRITDAKFRSAGCSYLVAANSLLTEQVKGKTTGEAAALAQEPESPIIERLGECPPDRTHCAFLACEGLISAVKTYSDAVREEWSGDDALICTCFGVSERTIEREISARGLRTIAEVTQTCNAGAGCRSCYPLIEDILSQYSREHDLLLPAPTSPPVDMKHSRRVIARSRIQLLAIAAGVFLIYLFSNPTPMAHFDYTFRIAEAILHGRLGMTESPPAWLNEMVLFEARYYSVFPLGSVLSLLPLALLKLVGVIDSFPAGLVAASLAAGSAAFFFLLSGNHVSSSRRVILTLFPLLATFAWCNLALAGAWQLALGFAVLGEAGALYFTLTNFHPFLAGIFFAMAFGNRTEVLLTAPIFIYFILRRDDGSLEAALPPNRRLTWHTFIERVSARRRAIVYFLSVPAILGIATLIYNYARFHSISDFGYMRIPQLAYEESFKHGLFSIYAIPANARAMLWEGWRVLDKRPYLIPHGFGGSIFLSSPFLLLLFRKGVRDYPMVIAAWIAIGVLTLLLWLHANPGGWQFSYRYGMILLPWMFLILLCNGGKKTSPLEVVLFVLSLAINAYATYLFLWTNYVQP